MTIARPKMTCRHADDEGKTYCCMECYELHLKRAKRTTAGAIALMFEHLAIKAQLLPDEKMYRHAARLVERWRDRRYVVESRGDE